MEDLKELINEDENEEDSDEEVMQRIIKESKMYSDEEEKS